MPIQDKTFEEFLNDILTDYENQDPSIDRSPATLVFIKSAATAAALWGLQTKLNNIGKKPFADVCLLDDLKHKAIIMGIQNIDSYIETDGTFPRLVAEVLLREQNAPAAGNEQDWIRWAKEAYYEHTGWTEYITNAKPYENKRGIGSVDIVLISDRTEDQGGEQEPSSEIIDAAEILFEAARSLGIASDFHVHAPTKNTQSITITISDASSAVTDDLCSVIEDAITDYMKTIPVGEKLYIAQIIAIAVNYGVNVETVSPDEDVVVVVGPDVYERIWPGTITVTEAA